MLNIKLAIIVVTLVKFSSSGILYPIQSATREVMSLDGLWNFQLKNPSKSTLNLMAVPASYNDIPAEATYRDYVGQVYYSRKIFVPSSWGNSRVSIRFGSVCYKADVLVNGEEALSHSIGHLPFREDITDLLKFGEENLIEVYVDNTLTNSTIPQGDSYTLSSGRLKQTYTFDFFNYAGIDRPVVLYTTPNIHIADITINTEVQATTGIVQYSIETSGGAIPSSIIKVLDAEGKVLVQDSKLSGELSIENANLWWPYLMDENPGYLYTLQVDLLDASGNLMDRYNQRFGIRSLSWDSTSFKINGKNIYIRGFGRHEDNDIKGKGLDLAMVLRDHNLLKWLGANAYRTSHYPYAEEIMDLADEMGIMIIDEVPAVNTENFNEELLKNHKQSLTELFNRDKNRPSVVVWSVANEPRTQYEESEDYYRQVVAHIKALDETRPVTIANNQPSDSDHSGQFLDILGFNIYHGWYSDYGDLDVVVNKLTADVKAWHQKHNKPVLLTEYGADTQEGLHILPEFIWSEEYQEALLSEHFKAFDALREEGYFVGEMLWNFADFKTSQTYTRVGGNKKGIFTRNRQPKSSAFLMRKRYWSLAQKLDGAELPSDLDRYVIEKSFRDEL